jgi:hypothetical protein
MLYAPRGDLVINGDFEDGTPREPPEDWMSQNVTLSGLPSAAFTGEQAAVLGGTDPGQPAVLYQDVNVAPLHRYQLSFQLARTVLPAGALMVEVRWLDSSSQDAGPGLHLYLPPAAPGTVATGIWDAQVHVTDFVPVSACFGRIVFTKGQAAPAPVILDAVTFADIA